MTYEDNQRTFARMMDQGFHCSQCVFHHWSEKMGIENDFSLRLVSGLGLGANHGDSCGAITSSALVLGLVHGFSDGSLSSSEGGVEGMVRNLEAEFIRRNGSVLCRDLLSGGYDGADPNAKAPDGIDPWENCAKYCADAVEIVESLVSEENLKAVPQQFAPKEDAGRTAIGAASGITGLAVGAAATAIIAYEKRRAENEQGTHS